MPAEVKTLKCLLKPIVEVQISKFAHCHDDEGVMCILQNIDNKNPIIRDCKNSKNYQTNEFYTILHWAAEHGHSSIIEYVCRFDFEKNPSDRHGQTPLHLAAKNGHFNIVKFLFQYVDEKNLPKAFGLNSPLDYAARSGCLETFKFLLAFADYKDLKAKSGKFFDAFLRFSVFSKIFLFQVSPLCIGQPCMDA